jgi:hypothetical protein
MNAELRYTGEEKMNQPNPKPIARLRPEFRRREHLLNWNLQLQAELEALVEDNKQLRAALSIYSEVARRSPASLSSDRQRVA